MALSAQSQADLVAWLEQYAAAGTALEAGAVAGTLAAYEGVNDWANTAATIAAATAAAKVAESAKNNAAGLAAQYAAVVTALLTGRRQGAVRYDLLRSLVGRRGVRPFQVYSRPIHVYRDVIARGGTPADAFAAARLRAEVLVKTDVLLADREAAILQFAAEGATRYRRVIRPELSASGTCGLCVAASDREYKIAELMPIHERCKCKVVPITAADDPGLRLNDEDLKRLYADAGGTTSGRALKRTRYRIENHGELGPILVNAEHPFRAYDAA